MEFLSGHCCAVSAHCALPAVRTLIATSDTRKLRNDIDLEFRRERIEVHLPSVGHWLIAAALPSYADQPGGLFHVRSWHPEPE